MIFWILNEGQMLQYGMHISAQQDVIVKANNNNTASASVYTYILSLTWFSLFQFFHMYIMMHFSMDIE